MSAEVSGVLIQGRYQLQDRIGSGGLGDVYLAWDTRLGRWVAIKRIRQPLDTSVSSGNDAWAEARTLAALQHPNVVTLYDYGDDELGPFFVMEYIQGTMLDDLLEGEQGLDEALLVEIAQQALEGLGAAHAQGLVHRDIKPSNFMLTHSATGRRVLKILDFGLAKFLQAPAPQTLNADSSLMGTVFYISPEQLQNQPMDHRADLYALGHVLYHLAAGRPAFDGETAVSIMMMHVMEDAADLSQLRPDLPVEFCQWIHLLMRRDKNERPSDARTALGMLNAIMAPDRRDSTVLNPPSEQSVPASTVAASRPAFVVDVTTSSPDKASGMMWWIGGGVGALLAVGVLFFLFLQPKDATAVSGTGSSDSGLPKVPPQVAATKPTAPGTPSAARGQPEVVPVPVPVPPVRAVGTRLDSKLEEVSPLDYELLRSKIGQRVTVSGMITRFGRTRDGSRLFLNFSNDFFRTLSLVFVVSRSPEFTQQNVEAFVGKRVRVSGEVLGYQPPSGGLRLQMELGSLSELEVIP